MKDEDVVVLPEQKNAWYYLKMVLLGLLVIVVIGLGIAMLIPDSPVLAGLFRLLEWIQKQPYHVSGTIMVLIFVIGVPIGAPVTILELVSGFIFGFWLGSLFAGIGIMLGTVVCFWIGIWLLTEWSEQQQREKKLIRAICFAVRKEALKLVILCKLSPVLPTFIMNYIFATTGMSFGIYLLGSVFGDLPWVFCYCYIGSVSKSLADAFSGEGQDSTTQIIFLVLGIVITVVLLVVVSYIGKKEIQKAMEQLDNEEILPLTDTPVKSYS